MPAVMSVLFASSILAVLVAPSPFIAGKLVNSELRWSHWLSVVAAASPIPVILSILPILMIFGETALNPKSYAIELAIATAWLWGNLAIFLFGLLSASLVVYRAGLRDSQQDGEPIE